MRKLLPSLILLPVLFFFAATEPGESATPGSTGESPLRPSPPPTFNKQVAPIIYGQCAPCHRPGQSGPFPLLTYMEVRKHGADIVKVTARRYMPPWLPEHGYGEFVGERRLTDEQIEMIRAWVAGGAIEGPEADRPPLPQWPADWELGKPDLIVTLAKPYTLAAEGKDLYRSFVLPTSLPDSRFVTALEFKLGNQRIVHHAFLQVDATPQSRFLDGRDGAPGFDGMKTPGTTPGGHFLSWQPGRGPYVAPPGLPWTLLKGDDLILEMHLQRTGKPEELQSSLGLYFSDVPPTGQLFKVSLQTFLIDIPAGEKNYLVKDSYPVPVDLQLLAVFPHAHYLAREMRGMALFPDGTKQWLLLIKHWDYNWQLSYRFVKPVFLPKGTILSMEYIYDNSAENERNPTQPPKRVEYGQQATDEMAELWLQVLPKNATDFNLLAVDYNLKKARDLAAYDESLLRKNPLDAAAHDELGFLYFNFGRKDEARAHIDRAVQIKPDFDSPHYHLGLLHRKAGQLSEAKTEFQTAIRLNPENYKAHGNLGLILLEEGKWNQAEPRFRAALRINPGDEIARESLDQILKAKAAGKK